MSSASDIPLAHTITMSFKPSTVQVIKPVTPTTATFRDDIFKGKVVLSTGGRSGIVYKMIRVMMTHGADSVIMGRK